MCTDIPCTSNFHLQFIYMYFSARQIQEKCHENQRTVHGIPWWCGLRSLVVCARQTWIPRKVPQHYQIFPWWDECQNCWCRWAIKPFTVVSSTKQGCILAPLLFSLCCVAMLLVAFRNNTVGVDTHCHTDGGIFNIRRLNPYSRILQRLAWDLLCANDCTLVDHSLQDCQAVTDFFAQTSKCFNLTVSIKRTKVLKEAGPGGHCLWERDSWWHGSKHCG